MRRTNQPRATVFFCAQGAHCRVGGGNNREDAMMSAGGGNSRIRRRDGSPLLRNPADTERSNQGLRGEHPFDRYGLKKARSRRDRAHGSNCCALLVLLLLRNGSCGVRAQTFVDGGTIEMSCTRDCECSGSSDSGTITVFDNPSSEQRVARVDGDHSEVLETSCGTSVVDAGGILYELSDISLTPRIFSVVDMENGECLTEETPDDADCSSGVSPTLTLDDGVDMYVEVDYGTWLNGSRYYKSNVVVKVNGSLSIVNEDPVPNVERFCWGNDFVSQLFSVEIGGETYEFNFEYSVPGEPASADLSVESISSSAADAFPCESDAPPSPSPAAITPQPAPQATEEPAAARTLAPTPETTAEASPRPTASPSIVALTAAPTVTTAAPLQIEIRTPAPFSSAPVVGSPEGTPGPVIGTPEASPEPTVPTTLSPSDAAALEGLECELPAEEPCTPLNTAGRINNGIGSYYDLACNTTAARAGDVPGCATDSDSLCRTCFWNTPLYISNNPDEEVPDYEDCPCCVLAVYDRDVAYNEDGARCQSTTPAPSAGASSDQPSSPPVSARPGGTAIPLTFEDNKLSIKGGQSVGLAGLALLTALTFLPIFR